MITKLCGLNYIRPKHLPRGFSHLVVACLYHPPTADNAAMTEYLKSCLEHGETYVSNCAIILAGGFNKLDFKAAAKCYQIKHIIKFPTRSGNSLNQIFMNIKSVYNSLTANPPLGLSDHVTVTVYPKVLEKNEHARKTIKVRPKRQTDIASLARFLLNIPGSDLLFRAGSC